MIPFKNIKVGITHGDPNGIGYEVILKTIVDNGMLDICTPVIYGAKNALDFHTKQLELTIDKINFIDSASQVKNKQRNFINCTDVNYEVQLGIPTQDSGKAAFVALEKAVEDLKNGLIDVLVTAPINKDNIQSENFNFPGHTEYLASKDEAEDSLMFMVSDSLKIAVVTGHIPVKEIANHLTPAIIEKKVLMMEKSLKNDFGITNPKIAILGLNPHAGDNGLLGKEDQEIIVPAIEKIKERGILAFGPFAADGFFGSAKYKNYDAVVAMYHDQGLIPFKTIAFGQGTNFTAGLSFIRTSPDHGTGYDIAGKNKADESSLRQAIYFAVDIFRCRMNEKDLRSNVLKSAEHRRRFEKSK